MGLHASIRTKLSLMVAGLLAGMAIVGAIALWGSTLLAKRVTDVGPGMTEVSASADDLSRRLVASGESSDRLGAMAARLGSETSGMRQLIDQARVASERERAAAMDALAETMLRLLDRRLDNAKFLADAVIKSADVRDNAAGFIAAAGADHGGPPVDGTAEEQRSALTDVTESLVASAGADFYAMIGRQGDLSGKVVESNRDGLVGLDMSGLSLLRAAIRDNRLSRGVDRITGELVLGSLALMKTTKGQDVAFFLCGYLVDGAAVRFLDQDLRSGVALFLRDGKGLWQARHSTVGQQDGATPAGLSLPGDLSAQFESLIQIAQTENRAKNRLVDVRRLRTVCRIMRQTELAGATYATVWQGLVSDTGELLAIVQLSRDITQGVAQERMIAKAADDASGEAARIDKERDLLVIANRTNQQEAKRIASDNAQARGVVGNIISDAGSVAGATRFGIAIALGVALTLGLVATALIIRGVNRSLSHIASDLVACVDRTDAASTSMAGSARNVANGTARSAAATEETSASLAEMTAMLQQTALNTRSASELSSQSRAAGERGSTAMKELGGAIISIKSASDQTAKIVKTIEEISFQTNLLALNAAIEAARAGDAGRGFAVVAAEVRNLANRTNEAARNTALLIDSGIASASRGVDLSATVQTLVNEMAAGSEGVGRLMGEIASSAQEVSQGIEQVVRALRQIDQVTQENAAGAEQASGISAELAGQTRLLRGQVEALKQIVGGRSTAAGMHNDGNGTPLLTSTEIETRPVPLLAPFKER
ncbi:MAG: methyl-accepting chemotaxis protein [Planctomycetes bacterium]|nr:methyl-accepting chemotaxis protein [Planctomycetota bacterium]